VIFMDQGASSRTAPGRILRHARGRVPRIPVQDPVDPLRRAELRAGSERRSPSRPASGRSATPSARAGLAAGLLSILMVLVPQTSAARLPEAYGAIRVQAGAGGRAPLRPATGTRPGARTGKPILLYFGASDCPACKVLERQSRGACGAAGAGDSSPLYADRGRGLAAGTAARLRAARRRVRRGDDQPEIGRGGSAGDASSGRASSCSIRTR
jgi:thiol-disulfide isomerase/thioredoxin